MAGRLRFATVWLGGCSGCHMSFLDLDEYLIELAEQVDFVFTPLVDAKVYPEAVDVVLIEGAVRNQENLEFLRRIRERTKTLIAFGDCAVTGNVTALRNPLRLAEPVLHCSYLERDDLNARIPECPGILPVLLDRVTPIHAVVPVDVHLPGCPPPAPRIRTVLELILAGQPVRLEGRDMIMFG